MKKLLFLQVMNIIGCRTCDSTGRRVCRSSPNIDVFPELVEGTNIEGDIK